MTQQEQLNLLIAPLSTKMDNIQSSLEEVKERLNTIEGKLFRGNGQPSYESRLTTLEDSVRKNDAICGACGFERFKGWILYSGIGLFGFLLLVMILEHAKTLLSFLKN